MDKEFLNSISTQEKFFDVTGEWPVPLWVLGPNSYVRASTTYVGYVAFVPREHFKSPLNNEVGISVDVSYMGTGPVYARGDISVKYYFHIIF